MKTILASIFSTVIYFAGLLVGVESLSGGMGSAVYVSMTLLMIFLCKEGDHE